MAYLIQRRKFTSEEWSVVQKILQRMVKTGDYLRNGLKLKRVVDELMVERYDRGYQCGYKRGLRRSEREGLDEWEED